MAPIVPLPEIRPSSQVCAGRELTNPRSGTGKDSEAAEKVDYSHTTFLYSDGTHAISQAARLELLEVGEEDRRLLAELAGVLSPHLDEILERWQEFLLSHADTRRFLVAEGVSKHLRAVLARWGSGSRR